MATASTSSNSAPSGATASQPFPEVTLPLTAIKDALESDVLCGRGGAAQRHPGNQHYRNLVSTNKPYYTTCPKPEKLKISRSIVATIRETNGRFLERGIDGLFYDIGDKKAVEKTSQALREGQPKMRKKIQAIQNHQAASVSASSATASASASAAGHRTSLDLSVAASNTTSAGTSADGGAATANQEDEEEEEDIIGDINDIDPNVEAAAAGFRSPLLEGNKASAVPQQTNLEQAYGTHPSRRGQHQQYDPRSSASSHDAASDPSTILTSAMAQAAAAAAAAGGVGVALPQYQGSVQRTPSGTPYVAIDGAGTQRSPSGGGAMEISEKSFRNLQAEAAGYAVGSNQIGGGEDAYAAQMHLLQQRQRALEQQQRHVQQFYNESPEDLEPNPIAVKTAAPDGSNHVGGGGDKHLPSFQTRTLAEEIHHQQQELDHLQQMHQHQHQQMYQLPLQVPPRQYQQQANQNVSNVSLMSTFSGIGDSMMSLGMLLSDRQVDVGISPISAASMSPTALAEAVRAQAPQEGVVEPAVTASPQRSAAAIAAAAAQASNAPLSPVHPNPDAGPVSIWDAGESNRDLATLAAGNTSMPKEKVMDYMIDADAVKASREAGGPPNDTSRRPKQVRRNSSVASRREIFASMKRNAPRRPSTVEADPGVDPHSGNTMSSVSSETVGSKKGGSSKGSGDTVSDVWRSAELRAAAAAGGSPTAAAAASGAAPVTAAGGSRYSVMSSADMDVGSNADISKNSGLSMMSIMTDLGSQFSLLDFEMDRNTGTGGMTSSTAVGQALAGAGFAAASSSAVPPSQEEMNASQFLASIGAGLSGSPRRGEHTENTRINEEEDYDAVS